MSVVSNKAGVRLDWMHALATGLLIGSVYFLVEKSGKREGKSITRNMFKLLPRCFAGIPILNMLWPGEWPN